MQTDAVSAGPAW